MATRTNTDGPDPASALGEALPSRLNDVRRAEQVMVLVRWIGTIFALVQILAYEARPFPANTEATAFGLVGLLAVANLVISLVARRTIDLPAARRLSVAAMSLDVIVISAFVWLFAFDQTSALWAVLFIVPLEGAIRFGLAGALTAWGASVLLYSAREVWGSSTYGYQLEWNSVSFRMGVGLLIALVAGLMARNLRQHQRMLEEALKDLSRIDRLRSRLVATLAHDVRNPLTAIRGSLTMLIRHSDTLNERTRSELLENADEQSRRLERLATDLLDLARLEEGHMELHIEDAPLREVVDRGVDYADMSHRFDIRVDPTLTVRADPARLEQIIVNLASNALRYGGPPFLVEADGADGHVTVRFRDGGPGIAEDERAHLFEPFRTETDHSSVGLGLAIVRALTEAQGGVVGYEANTPRGACFSLTLPAGDSVAVA